MDIVTESVVKANLDEALRQAEERGDQHATMSVGLLKKLWASYAARGEALGPFARAAGILTNEPDDAMTTMRVTCGDLRDARRARPG
jgi:hypothetical protein